MKRWWWAPVLLLTWATLLLPFLSPPARSQLSQSSLLSLIGTNVPSGNPNVLTAASLRAVLNQMVLSTNEQGTSCPTTLLTPFQPWGNNNVNPGVLNVFDSTACAPWALLHNDTHKINFRGDAMPLSVPGTNIAARFGSMDVWQRGAGNSSFINVNASTTAYTVDGCYLATGANEAGIVQSFAGIGSTGVGIGSNRSALVSRASGQTGTATMTFGCPFDTDEITIARGSFVTLSFFVQTSTNFSPVNGAITASVLCGTGTPVKQVSGYTNQVTVISFGTNLGVSSNIQRLQATSTAIVPTNCTQMEVQWTWSPTGTAGGADLFALDSIALEVVDSSIAVASPFQNLDFGTQLRMAQRHFAKTFAYGTAPAQNVGNTGMLVARVTTATNPTFQWRLPVQMRVTPAVTTFNPGNTNANCRDTIAGSDLAVTNPDTAVTNTGDMVGVFCAPPGSNNNSVAIHMTADAGI